MFKKAVKYESRGRIALIGPAGSGKSYTMLLLASALANGKRIAAIDTEHGSLSKYADQFDFDVIELSSYSPSAFLECLGAAEKNGYGVFCCDSLSHFWMGKDGALEFVDHAKRRSQSRDDMSGWKEFRPHERQMVDAMIASPCHVICTMRTKTAYEEQVNERTGKKQRIKIGLAPVQRDGMEYEFDFVGSMDDENNLVVDKSRCPAYAGKVLAKPGAKEFAAFIEWLKGAPPNPVQPTDVVRGTVEDQRRVAEEKLAAVRTAPPEHPRTIDIPSAPPEAPKPQAVKPTATSKNFDMLGAFREIKGKIGDANYYRILGANGYEKSNEIMDVAKARAIYREMGECLKAMMNEAEGQA